MRSVIRLTLSFCVIFQSRITKSKKTLVARKFESENFDNIMIQRLSKAKIDQGRKNQHLCDLRNLLVTVKTNCTNVDRRIRRRLPGQRCEGQYVNYYARTHIRNMGQKIERFRKMCCHDKCDEEDQEEFLKNCKGRTFRCNFLQRYFKQYIPRG